MDNNNVVIQPKIDTVTLNTTDQMLTLAIQNKADIAILERLLDMRMKCDAIDARKRYILAMTEFKKNPPKINRDAKVKFKEVSYKYATLGNVTDKINSRLSEHGLSASWKIEQREDLVSVTCRITHVAGHSEETTLSAKIDKMVGLNAIQAIGSTISYLERYTLLSLTGLAASCDDKDGMGEIPPPQLITNEQLNAVRDAMLARNVSESKLVKFLKVESLENMTSADYKKAMSAITAKKEEPKQAEKQAE